MATTPAAPCLSRQSVKPPVDEPMSIQTKPAGSTPNSINAASSFSPPRLAYLFSGESPLILIATSMPKSGDGCGQHWLTCQGEVIPSAPELKTVIEFSHRVTSSLAGILLIVLLVWAFWRWRSRNNKQNRLTVKAAFGAFIFVVIEGLLGA